MGIFGLGLISMKMLDKGEEENTVEDQSGKRVKKTNSSKDTGNN